MINTVVKTLSKRVYGEIRVYPHPECSNAVLLAKLTSGKTFSAAHIKTIEALGYTIDNTNVL